MNSRGNRRGAVAVTLIVLLVAAAFAGIGMTSPVRAQSLLVSDTTTIDVTASNGYAFTPNMFQQVPTGSNVTVVFTDASDLAHTFTIIGRQGWVIPSTASETQLDALAWGKSPARLFNLNVSGSGAQVTGNFTSPGAGWYEFFCTEAGHFAYGMYGFIAFGMNLPGNLTISSGVPGPGAALYIIIGTIVSLVVIALVLGFVFGRRKGSEHEMPPERLGYPEPVPSDQPLPPSSERGRSP